MSLLKRYPYASFFLIMLIFGGLEAGLTPLLTFLGEEGLALAVPLYYFTKALAVIAPFLMMGGVAYAMCEGSFLSSLPFFGIYTAVRILLQFPLSLYEYSESLSSPYLLVLVVYLLTAILNAAVFFFLLLLGYLLFVRRGGGHEKRFFGISGADTRTLWLAVAVIAVQDTVVFAVGFIEHLKGKLWIFDWADLTDALFSIAFIGLCALLSFAAGRFAMRAFYTQEKRQE